MNLEIEEKIYSRKDQDMCVNDGYVIFRNSELVCGRIGKVRTGKHASLCVYVCAVWLCVFALICNGVHMAMQAELSAFHKCVYAGHASMPCITVSLMCVYVCMCHRWYWVVVRTVCSVRSTQTTPLSPLRPV